MLDMVLKTSLRWLFSPLACSASWLREWLQIVELEQQTATQQQRIDDLAALVGAQGYQIQGLQNRDFPQLVQQIDALRKQLATSPDDPRWSTLMDTVDTLRQMAQTQDQKIKSLLQQIQKWVQAKKE